VLLQLTRDLIYSNYRDPGEEPKLHLFGQLKRIARQLCYRELADMTAD
jgi:type III restriction enzyme